MRIDNRGQGGIALVLIVNWNQALSAPGSNLSHNFEG